MFSVDALFLPYYDFLNISLQLLVKIIITEHDTKFKNITSIQ